MVCWKTRHTKTLHDILIRTATRPFCLTSKRAAKQHLHHPQTLFSAKGGKNRGKLIRFLSFSNLYQPAGSSFAKLAAARYRL